METILGFLIVFFWRLVHLAIPAVILSIWLGPAAFAIWVCAAFILAIL